jgi:hypothetical protein
MIVRPVLLPLDNPLEQAWLAFQSGSRYHELKMDATQL